MLLMGKLLQLFYIVIVMIIDMFGIDILDLVVVLLVVLFMNICEFFVKECEVLVVVKEGLCCDGKVLIVCVFVEMIGVVSILIVQWCILFFIDLGLLC